MWLHVIYENIKIKDPSIFLATYSNLPNTLNAFEKKNLKTKLANLSNFVHEKSYV
jgi:hypothetical protein